MPLEAYPEWSVLSKSTGCCCCCCLLFPSPPPTFCFHSSYHFYNVLIPALHAELFEKVWHFCFSLTDPVIFGCIFYVFQIQVNLKVPASQVTLTLRTSQKMVSVVGDSSCCCSQSPTVAKSQPSTRIWGLSDGQLTVGTTLRSQGVLWIILAAPSLPPPRSQAPSGFS